MSPARRAPMVLPGMLPSLSPTMPGAWSRAPTQRGGRGLRAKPGEMNGLERERAEELEVMRQRGELVGWWYEPESFRLADNTRYTPDFRLLYADGRVVFEETKGRWEDDARVKIKVAAQLHPYEFVALTKRPKRDGGGWNREAFKGWSEPNSEASSRSESRCDPKAS